MVLALEKTAGDSEGALRAQSKMVTHAGQAGRIGI
jgi:hypothetical protein